MANKTALDAMSPRARRYYLQAFAGELLPNERVAKCLRCIAPHMKQHGVDIIKSKLTSSTRYKNLTVCASVWVCPVCSATITERRRVELTNALLRNPQYQSVLITLTLRHHLGMKLVDTLWAIQNAWARFISGRQWQSIKAAYGWVGFIRALEVTHGKNGFHPHYHVLAFMVRTSPIARTLQLVADIDVASQLELDLRRRWIDMLECQGYSANWDNGLTVEISDTRIANYVTKYGREPINSGWSLEHELTKSPVKNARDTEHGRTAFRLLLDYSLGDTDAGRIFVEYANAMKGQRQLYWSVGLRRLLGIDEESEDDKLADATVSEDESVFATLTAEQWRFVVKQIGRSETLDKASAMSIQDFDSWLSGLIRQRLQK